MRNRSKIKAFTILELLVVVAIIGIIAVIALPNFIGRIDEAKDAQNLAEINAVEKAIATYYADNGTYPTLQGKDGALVQSQPIEGSPHNIDFSSLVPNYLATLPHFSYWWVDYLGNVYHTEKAVATVTSGLFTPTDGYTYTVYKANGTKQVLSAPYTLQAGDYVVGNDEKGVELPKVGSAFKNAKMHPEDPEYIASIAITGVALNKSTTTLLQGNNETLTVSYAPSDATNKSVTWSSNNASVATVDSVGKVVGVASGTATITVTSVDGSKTASCVVTVTPLFTSQTFSYIGSVQTFTVPATGTYQLEVWGAQGGAGISGRLGGAGGYAKGNITLNSGQILYIYVGGQGAIGTATSSTNTAGGWNGGGKGYNNGQGGSGGGGGSDIRIGGQALNNRKIVAGGGGGATHVNIGGAGGGLSGEKPDTVYTYCGGGGTQTAGGTAGSNGAYTGSLGVGGDSLNDDGAGGGGGYYGGGGGSNDYGGGGGSGYIGGVTSGTLQTGQKTGNGQAKITYVGP